MKIIKSDWRTRLTNPALNDQMVILLSGSSVDSFNPGPAIDLWHEEAIRPRRPIEDADDNEDEILDDVLAGRDMLERIVQKISTHVVNGNMDSVSASNEEGDSLKS